jgi:hypothetical protein
LRGGADVCIAHHMPGMAPLSTLNRVVVGVIKLSFALIALLILVVVVCDPIQTHLLIRWIELRVERLWKFVTRNCVPWTAERENENDVGTTEIHLLSVNRPQNRQRDWDVLVIHDGEVGKEDGSLLDPFTGPQYSRNFKFFADGSFGTPEDRRTQEFKNRIINAGREIGTYGGQLLEQLNLDRNQDSVKVRNVTIVEDSTINNRDDDTSLHNPVWEILERTEFWSQSAPERVNVRRVLLDGGRERELGSKNSDTGVIQPLEQADPPAAAMPQALVDAPFRILLLIGRNIVDKTESSFWKYEEMVEPDVIQRSLIQAIYHLKEIGHDPGVELEILRPATFDELKRYLGFDAANPNSPKEQFDIIHVDMHGEMLPKMNMFV